jgi:toxin-antitoxin system PIN domain toxin
LAVAGEPGLGNRACYRARDEIETEMITCDTNILFPALEVSHKDHPRAREFMEMQVENREFAVCELVLMEVYTLLRNPVICAKPLSAAAAVRKIHNLRTNPRWAVLDYPGNLMSDIWREAERSEAFRRIYDVRLALTLRFHGVQEFATVNTKDFSGLGFEKLWNPLKE